MTNDWQKLLVGIALVAFTINTATNLAHGQIPPPTLSYSATPLANQPIIFDYSGRGPTSLAIYTGSNCPGMEGSSSSSPIVTLTVPKRGTVTLAGGLPAGSYSAGIISTVFNYRGYVVCNNFSVINSGG
ncbi:MAG: hypothetical protein ACLP9D_04430 [Candidatus Bathyarchaeia archaeon]